MAFTESPIHGRARRHALIDLVETHVTEKLRLQEFAVGNTADGSGLDEYAIVTIDGERGSGKTTTLRDCQERLRSTGHLVLPLIRPELFAAGDSLLQHALAHLVEALRADHALQARGDTAGEESALRPVQLAAERLVRHAAVFNDLSLVGNLDQVASDTKRAAEGTATFFRDLDSAVRDIRVGLRTGTGIVAFIDDADLSANRVSPVLADLRVLCSVPGIVAIVALDIREMRRILIAEHRRLLGHPGPSAPDVLAHAPELVNLVDLQLAKILPADARVPIPRLSREDRLGFTPPGAIESLEEILRTVALPRRLRGTPDLASLFVTARGAPTLYSDALSHNARDLASLHRSLSILSSSNSLDAPTAAKLVIDHGLDAGVRRTGVLELDAADVVDFGTGDQDTTLDLAPIDVFTVGTRKSVALPLGGPHGSLAATAYQEEHGRLSKARTSAELNVLRPSEGRVFLDFRRGYTTRDEGQSKRAAVPADQTLVAAILLTQELGSNYQLPSRLALRSGGPLTRGGSLGRHLVAVDNTDNRFLLLPPWEGYLDYWLFDEAWSEVLRQVASKYGGRGRPVAAHAVCEGWRLVSSIQRVRSVPAARMARWLQEPRSALRTTMATVSDVYHRSLSSTTTRATDFVFWFETLLPQSFHPVLFTATVVEQLLAWRSRTIADAERVVEANEVYAEVLEDRIRANLGSEFVDALVIQLAAVASDRAQDVGMLHEQRKLQFERERQRLIGAEATRSVVDPSVEEQSLGPFEIAMNVLQALEDDAIRSLRRGP